MISKTLGQMLDGTEEKYPDNDALVYVDRGLRLTYRQFREKVDELARGLMAQGVVKGEHIAVWTHNVPEWVYLQFATAKVGAVLVTVNTYYRSHELEYLLRQSDSTTLILVRGFKEADYVKIVNEVMPELCSSALGNLKCAKLPLLRRVVFIGSERHPGMMPFDELFTAAAGVTPTELAERQALLDADDVVNMQYTSGTTGFPKGVMLTHSNIVNNARQVGSIMGMTEKDRMCIPVPFFHCFGCVLSTLNCVVHGSTMVPLEVFDAKGVLEAVSRECCTVLNGVPTMFIAELQHPDFSSYDLKSLRTGIMAGAPCPVEVMKQVMDKMHAKEVTIAYGLTETSPVLTQTRRDDPLEKRVETVGRVIEGVECKVVDQETGEDIPVGEPGELIARGYGVMKGYYKMEDATARTIRDGWLHTKDLSSMDSDGYFRILGRCDDMIIRGGENVYPREIEEFFYTNPKILDIAVVGVPDPKYSEEVYAFIKLREGQWATAEELRDFCRDRIARYKIPRYFQFVDSFPLTASGKVQKFKLKEVAKGVLDSIKQDGSAYNIRKMADDDAEGIIRVFNHYVEEGFAAYPEMKLPPAAFPMFKEISKGYPFYVLEDPKRNLVGFAFLHRYDVASSFDRTAEVSYFIAPDHTKKGQGKRLLEKLVDDAKAMGITTLLANLSSRNEASLAFLSKHGFTECGRFRGIGQKMGVEFDVVWMQRALQVDLTPEACTTFKL
jgi:fatty-acyl-CoA synthase